MLFTYLLIAQFFFFLRIFPQTYTQIKWNKYIILWNHKGLLNSVLLILINKMHKEAKRFRAWGDWLTSSFCLPGLFYMNCVKKADLRKKYKSRQLFTICFNSCGKHCMYVSWTYLCICILSNFLQLKAKKIFNWISRCHQPKLLLRCFLHYLQLVFPIYKLCNCT